MLATDSDERRAFSYERSRVPSVVGIAGEASNPASSKATFKGFVLDELNVPDVHHQKQATWLYVFCNFSGLILHPAKVYRNTGAMEGGFAPETPAREGSKYGNPPLGRGVKAVNSPQGREYLTVAYGKGF